MPIKQCPNCGIVIGGVYEKVLHSYNGLRLCSFCLETLLDRGWLCRSVARRPLLKITFADRSTHTVPEAKFKPKGLTCQQLQEKLEQYRD